jgi:hypothetical protein
MKLTVHVATDSVILLTHEAVKVQNLNSALEPSGKITYLWSKKHNMDFQ